MAPQTDIGIDFGTNTIVIYAKNKGIIIREPALVAYDKDSDQVRAFGEEARQLVGHTAGNNVAIKPLAQGKISNFVITEKMLKYFVNKSIGRRGFLKPRISVCVPSGVTEVEKRAVIEATYQAGARDVHLVSEPVAVAVGAELDITKPDGNMVVDVGGGLTDIAVISLCGIVVSSSINIAGEDFNRTIIEMLRKNYGLFIGEQTAETIKMVLGSTNSSESSEQMTVNGRNIDTGLPKSVTLDRDEVQRAFRSVINQIINGVKNVLERTPPDLAGDIQSRGILLAGGGCQVEGLQQLMERRLGIKVLVAENPASVVAIGTGRYSQIMDQFENRREM